MTRFAHYKAFQWDKITKVAVPKRLGRVLVVSNSILFAVLTAVIVWLST